MPSGTPGNDNIVGTDSAEIFDVSQGGRDTVSALGGDDTIMFGAAFTARDQADGGDGWDILTLAGDYSAGVNFRDTTMQNVEQIKLEGAFSYSLKLADANLSPLDGFVLDATGLGAGHSFVLDASAETDAGVTVVDSHGDDTIIGGGGGDFIELNGGGSDTVYGGAGNDGIEFGFAFDFGDRIFGGDGFDYVTVHGLPAGGSPVRFTHKQFVDVEEISIRDGGGNVAFASRVVAPGATVSIDFANTSEAHFDGHEVKSGNLFIDSFGPTSDVHFIGGHGDDTLEIDLSTATNDLDGGGGSDFASFVFAATGATIYLDNTGPFEAAPGIMVTLANIEDIQGSAHNDALHGNDKANTLFGLAGNDLLDGGPGRDLLSGGAGADTEFGGTSGDTFRYALVSYSTGVNHDILADFNALRDTLLITAHVEGVDPEITHGTLSTASFDADLAAAVAGNLGVSHAILFTPDAGDQAGKTILIVDNNGSAAYESGSDLVIELQNAKHLGHLATAFETI